MIKGCPFCGSSTVILEPVAIRCPICNASVPGKGQEEIFRKWNARSSDLEIDLNGAAYARGVEAFMNGHNTFNSGYEYLSKLSDREKLEWIEGYKRAYMRVNNERPEVVITVGCIESTVRVNDKTYVDNGTKDI